MDEKGRESPLAYYKNLSSYLIFTPLKESKAFQLLAKFLVIILVIVGVNLEDH